MPDSTSLRACALVLFCRRPLPGSGKRRLARDLGEAGAFALGRALLECALEDAAAWPGRLVVSPARAGDAAWAEGLLGRPKWVLPQPDGNLGQRINAIDTAVRERRCNRVLFIGSDSPSMQLDDLETAAAVLEYVDIVLIPAADGGVTLMGSRVGWPPLSDLPWSESALGGALERCCRAAGLSVERLSPSFDIDQVSDLPLALEALAHDARPARRRLNELLTALTRPAAARELPGCGPAVGEA